MKIKSIYISILLSIISIQLNGQTPKLRHYKVEDGLPSATVYHVFQDSRDFLWLSTEAGLARFDGTTFRNYSMDDGLPDNEIFGVFEDSRNRLWLRTYNGKLAYIKNNKIYNNLSGISLSTLETSHWIVNIFEDSAQNLYFSQHKDGLSILLKTKFLQFKPSDFRKLLNAREELQIEILGCYEGKSREVHIVSNVAAFVLENEKLSLQRVFEEPISEFTILKTGQLVAKTAQSNDLLLIEDKQELNSSHPLITNDQLKFDVDVLLLSESELGGIWLGTLGEGLFLLDNLNNNPQIVENYLENQSVSFVTKDKEGNIWMSTLGNGIYMLSNDKVLTFNTEYGLSDNELFAITGNDKGDIFIGTQSGTINYLRPNGSIQILQTGLDSRRYDRIRALALDHKENLWVGSDAGLVVFGMDKNFDIQNIKSIAINDKDNIFIGSTGGLYLINNQYATKELWNERVNAIAPIKDGKAWLGSNNGLYFYDGKTVKIEVGNPLYRYRINDLLVLDNNMLCICTAGNGILIKNGNTVSQLTKKDGLTSNVCTDIYRSADGEIWMASNRGVSKFSLENGQPRGIFSYTESEFLSSNEVRGVYVRNDTVWAATSAGLSYIERVSNAEKSTLPPTFYITDIRVNGRDTALTTDYDLEYYQNDIQVAYTGISYKSGSQVRYRYQLEGWSEDWVETSSKVAHFPYLQSGHYVFRIQAISIDGKMSEERKISFTIRSPWWKTPFFILSVSIIVLGLAGGFINNNIKNREDKIQLKKQISESESMALRAQMNPHFIFNALNSIQHFITMEDEVSANYYLSQFAKLIRRVLENSKTTLISLEDEITTLTIYLKLEALRFEGKFNYEINVEEDIDTYDVELPSMIIQPFAENAIWHGLMPKQDGTPTLIINFKRDVENLICEVIDNGIGREAAAKVSKKNLSAHQSTGISNTIKRLDLMSKREKKKARVEFVDLKEGDKSLGTKVIVRIPFLEFDED